MESKADKGRLMTNETAIKKELKDYLEITGWFVFHLMAGIGSYPGAPDLIAIRNGIVLFIEAKAVKGKLSNGQKVFQSRIQNSNGHYIVAHSHIDIVDYLNEHVQ